MNRYLIDYIDVNGTLIHYFCNAFTDQDAKKYCKRDNNNLKEILQVIKTI